MSRRGSRWAVLEECPVCRDRLVGAEVQLVDRTVFCGACGSFSALAAEWVGTYDPRTVPRPHGGFWRLWPETKKSAAPGPCEDGPKAAASR